MHWRHVLLMCVLIFFWLWSLPLLLLAAVACVPAAWFTLVGSVSLSLVLQWCNHDRIVPRHFVRRWLARIPWHQWFPCTPLHFQGPAVVSVHPHGLLCCGALAGIHLVPESTSVLAVAPILFYVPVIGWMLRVIGCIPAELGVMREALQRGCVLLVVPGGVPEIVLAESGDDCRRFPRHGFLRLARSSEVPLWCVFVRGECGLFSMIRGPCLDWRAWCSWRFNVPFVMPIFLGWYGTWLPKRTPLKLARKRCDVLTKEGYGETLRQLMYLTRTTMDKCHE